MPNSLTIDTFAVPYSAMAILDETSQTVLAVDSKQVEERVRAVIRSSLCIDASHLQEQLTVCVVLVGLQSMYQVVPPLCHQICPAEPTPHTLSNAASRQRQTG